MKRTLALIAFMLPLILTSVSVAYQADPPPGSIKLLPGYKHKTEQGIDTRVGRIWKEGGLTIEYDIGVLAGYYAKPEESGSYSWYREQNLGKQNVRCALKKDGQLIVTFPDSLANFFAQVKSQEDVADVLLMLLTYEGKKIRL